MPSREELLQSIQSDMKLNKAFFMKVYGYEITYPGFKERAISKLEEAGCSKAEEYYNRFVGEYEENKDKELKEVARWAIQELGQKWEGRERQGEKLRKQKITQDLQKKSDRELLNLLQSIS